MSKSAENSESFCAFYRDLAKRDQSSDGRPVRFFSRFQGDFFSAYGEDAILCAEFYSTTQVIKYIGPVKNRLAMVDNRLQRFATILKSLLLEQKRTVELYDKDKTTGEWTVVKTGTPGNVHSFEEFLLMKQSSLDTANIMSMVWSTAPGGEDLMLGVAFVDASERRIQVAQFLDSANLPNFESALLSRSAREALLYEDPVRAAEMKQLRQVLARCAVPVVESKKGDFRSENIAQDLGRLVGDLQGFQSLLDQKNAMQALSAVLKYLDKNNNIMSSEDGYGKWKLSGFDLSNSMRLNEAAWKALSLFPQPSDCSKTASLFGLLNKCRTAMGSRKLTSFMKQPSLDKSEIETRLDLVQLFYNETILRQTLREEYLSKVPDLMRLSRKFTRGKANLQDVVGLYSFCLLLPHLVEALGEYNGEFKEKLEEHIVKPLKSTCDDMTNFILLVEKLVDLDACGNHEYIVRSDFSADLKALAEQKDACKAKMEQIRSKVASDLGVPDQKLQIQHVHPYGYHLSVPKKAVKRLETRYHVFKTQKQVSKFTSPMFKRRAADYEMCVKAYDEASKALIDKCLEVTATFSPVMESAGASLALLDVILAFAESSAAAPDPFVRPRLEARGTGALRLVGARHPCVEAQCVHFIANDVDMEKGKSHFQIITGPNMGGKSTYIRSVGVICLMAQIGCFVPCREATIPILDAIMARVGASDNLLKGVSTFMAEMLEASSILKTATNDSLVIIDELGRGTSTYDGFGIAWAISEEIAQNIGSFCMFATHFHELTDLPKCVPGAVNRHVSAHAGADSITMLYRVAAGACDRSFGIHVAELTKFPESVVEAAKQKAAQLENFGEKLDFSSEQSGENDMDTSEDVPSSSSVEDEESLVGQKLLLRFLSEFDSLDQSSMTGAEAREATEQWRERVEAEAAQNGWLRRCLDGAVEKVAA
eukprot:225010_1